MNPHITSDAGRNVQEDALLTDLARVRELMDTERASAADYVATSDALRAFLRTHASGIEAMARDNERLRESLRAVLRQDAADQILGLTPTIYLRTRQDAAAAIGETPDGLLAGVRPAIDAMKEAGGE